MNRVTLGLAALMVCLSAAFSNMATAASIVDLLGDKDGFGLAGAPAIPADGTNWRDDLGGIFFTDDRDAGDLINAPFSDIWSSPDSFSYTHSYALGALTPLIAVLEVQIAGIHDINTGQIYDVIVDATTIGQIPANLNANAFQEVKLYSFNVPLALISGSESLSVSMTGLDGYSINFSELTIEVVPEPATAFLIGIGALVLLPYRPKRAKNS